jgi:hypothetical protein
MFFAPTVKLVFFFLLPLVQSGYEKNDVFEVNEPFYFPCS